MAKLKLTPQERGRLGGKARAKNLTPEQVSEIARKAGKANTPEQQREKRMKQIEAAKKKAGRKA